MTKHFTDDNFQQEVIEASKEKPVLVDFFAVWCGPCQMQAPIIDEVAKELGEEAVVGKLNTEQAQQTAANYGVMSIPTLLIFRNGEIVKTFVGLMPKETLITEIKQNI
ncbi:MAG: thioredoxin [bacterium]